MLSRRDCCCRDPDDDTILALAATGRADVIITEDDDLLVLNPFDGIRILRPREFWSWAAAPVGEGGGRRCRDSSREDRTG